MRALVWVLSVTMPIWAPVKLMAVLAEGLDGHGHQGDGDLLAGGQEHVHFAGRRLLGDLAGQFDQLVGGVARALTTTMTWLPACLARIARRAAAMIRSALATLVPPNFCTTRPTLCLLTISTNRRRPTALEQSAPVNSRHHEKHSDNAQTRTLNRPKRKTPTTRAGTDSN